MIPCTRCGLCCTIELCSKGRRRDKKKKGNCKYLIDNDNGTTSCQLILEGKMKNSAIEFGQGCVFQTDYHALYNFYSETILKKAIKQLFNERNIKMIFEDEYIFNHKYIIQKPKQRFIKFGNLFHFIVDIWFKIRCQ